MTYVKVDVLFGLVRVVGGLSKRHGEQPVAGRGEGTLAAWPRLPSLAAKTGTLRHTVALAGILHPDSDAPSSSATSSTTTRGPGRPPEAR